MKIRTFLIFLSKIFKNYIIEIKKLIRNFCTKNQSLFNRQLKWKLLKYEITEFTIRYTKQATKGKRQQRTNLENQLKKTERNLDEDKLSKCNSVKNELDVIYHHITEGKQIRSKYDWYEHGENLTKIF